jgi:hypothetical protein
MEILHLINLHFGEQKAYEHCSIILDDHTGLKAIDKNVGTQIFCY